MSEAAKKAVENHKKGYNCAQAVACAFCDQLGKDEKEVFEKCRKIMERIRK